MIRDIVIWLMLLANCVALCAVAAWPGVKGKRWLVAFLSLVVAAEAYFRFFDLYVRLSAAEPRYELYGKFEVVQLFAMLLLLLGQVFLVVSVLRLRSFLNAVQSAGNPTLTQAAFALSAAGGFEADLRMQRDVMVPLKDGHSDIGAHLSTRGAAISSPHVGDGVRVKIADELTKQLRSAGRTLKWMQQPNGASLVIRLIQVEAGNQFLRYMIPFASPAVVEIEGDLLLPAGLQSFHMIRKTHFSILGGGGGYMTRVCAARLAAGVRKWLLTTI
jgi:hypothetical protein